MDPVLPSEPLPAPAAPDLAANGEAGPQGTRQTPGADPFASFLGSLVSRAALGSLGSGAALGSLVSGAVVEEEGTTEQEGATEKSSSDPLADMRMDVQGEPEGTDTPGQLEVTHLGTPAPVRPGEATPVETRGFVEAPAARGGEVPTDVRATAPNTHGGPEAARVQVIPHGRAEAPPEVPIDPGARSGLEPGSVAGPEASSGSSGAQGDSRSFGREAEGEPDPGRSDLVTQRGDAGPDRAQNGVSVRAHETETTVDPAITRAEGAARSEAPQIQGTPRAVPELPSSSEAAILRGARVLANEGGGTARIQLHPPQLGGLEIRIAVNDRSVRVSLVADRTAVADLLHHHLPGLRHALQLQGLAVDRVEVAHHHGGELRSDRDPGSGEPFSGRESSDEFREESDRGGQEPRAAHSWDAGPLRLPIGGGPIPLVVTSLGTVDVRA
jgi:hypothetical protein